MECIKEKCKYFMEHDFMCSAFKCQLHPYHTYKKDSSMDCLIPLVIKEYQDMIKLVKEHQIFIKSK